MSEVEHELSPTPESREMQIKSLLELILLKTQDADPEFRMKTLWDKETRRRLLIGRYGDNEPEKLAHINVLPEYPFQYPHEETHYAISNRQGKMEIDGYEQHVLKPHEERATPEQVLEAVEKTEELLRDIKDAVSAESFERGLGFTHVSDQEICGLLDMVSRGIPFEGITPPE